MKRLSTKMSARTCLLPAVLLALYLPLTSSASFREPEWPDELETIDEAMMQSPGAAPQGRSYARDSILDGLDMMLTDEQYARLYSGKRGRSSGRTIATPWTDGVVPYEIAKNNFTEEGLIEWIEKAFRNWEAVTCVKFRPAKSDDRNRIIIREGNGCWAHLGMLGGTQTVNLDTNGCFWKGTIEHEFGHTLGLIHEHQREQRDAYIRISYYSVRPDFVSAVKKYARGADDKMGLPYDYTSVMHYGKTAFSKDRTSQTLFTRDPTKQDVIGMILWPSFLDAKLVNLMYKCADKCDNPPSCSDDCYVTSDCRCLCERDMPQETCRDLNEECPQWAQEAECEANYGYMFHYCRKSCGICKTDGSIPKLPCVNGREECELWKSWNHCEIAAGYMHKRCKLACGLCTVDDDYTPKGPCEDKNSSCAELAAKGECVKNTASMLKDCTKSCDFCPEDIGDDPTRKPGCVDTDYVCTYWKEMNLCHKHYGWMTKNCPNACDACDVVNSAAIANCEDDHPKCFDWAYDDQCVHYEQTREQCKLSCNMCEGLPKPPEKCLDYRFTCPWWAETRFECWGNPGWMGRNCKKSCKLCPGDPPQPEVPCMDFRGDCPQWQRDGECEGNPGWMKDYCRVSCGVCQSDGSGDCADYSEKCPEWAKKGECETKPEFMFDHCKGSCKPECPESASNVTGPVSGSCYDDTPDCKAWADNDDCHNNAKYMLIHCKKSCKNCGACEDTSQHCPSWAKNDQCHSNPGYMLRECKKSCKVC